MIKHILLSCFVFFSSVSYGQDYKFTPDIGVVFDSSKGKELLVCCSRACPENITGYWTPSGNDISILENNFKKIYELESKGCCIKGNKVKDLSAFAFQYLGVWKKAKKYIYINAFVKSDIDLFKINKANLNIKAFVVCDGGEYLWGALFDIEAQKFIFIAFNGFG